MPTDFFAQVDEAAGLDRSATSSRDFASRAAIALSAITAAALSTITAAALCLAASGAVAHEVPDSRNRVSFQVEAVREVANDWALARLTISAEGKDPAAIAQQINQEMAAAVKKAERVDAVEVRTGSYVTQPVYRDNRIVRWRASQELRLESADTDRLAELVGDLQGDRVLLSGISFSVQRSTRTRLEDSLIQEAMQSFRARAALIAKGMGAADWELVKLSVNPSGGHPQRMQMRAEADMMSMSKAPPVFEAGSSELRVQISGTVELE